MKRSATPPLLHELLNPPNSAAQLVALKALKNDLIGHELKKRLWIGYGIVQILSRILSSGIVLNGKRARRDLVTAGVPENGRTGMTDDESSCLQTAVIVGILARAGSNFVKPILRGNILPPLVSILSSVDCPQEMALAILKAFNTIADRLPPSSPNDWPQDRQLADLLYAKDRIGCLKRLIDQVALAAGVQESVLLTVSLICKTCTDERQKEALVDAGILDALASKLASFVVLQGFVLPGAETLVQESGSSGALPPPASPKAKIAPFLQATALLVEHSKAHAEHFLSSAAIMTVFPKPQAEFSPTDVKKAPWGTATYLSGAAVPRHTSSNPIDSLLPTVPATPATVSVERLNFPPLGSVGPTPKRQSSFNIAAYLSSAEAPSFSATNEDDESPMISWLIFLVRAESGMPRLMAAKLLIVLFRLGKTRKSRSSTFAMLLVPLLIRFLDKDYELTGLSEIADCDVLPLRLRLKEEAPALLAGLVMDSQKLQKAAVDGNAIKKLSQLLKETFDPLPGQEEEGMWSPEKPSRSTRNGLESDTVPVEMAPTPIARHLMKFREGLLKALAAIAPFDDDYRRAICDQGVMPYIIDSLKPYTAITQPSDDGVHPPNTIPGNPAPTLLAACGAARALTRSVSMLRTSLIDAGIAPPLFNLLKNPDVEVQIAATSVVINLALNFSPMKEAIVTHGIVKTLCEHAHSANPRLRLDAIWALKHLVYDSSNDLKMRVIQELGPSWIKQLISTDPADIPEGTIIGMGATNFAGQRLDLLNPMSKDGAEDLMMTESTTTAGARIKGNGVGRRLYALTERADPNKHTIKDDIAIQEQLLDLLRNMFCGDGATDMIDYVFREMGQRDFFEILVDRIRPRTSSLGGGAAAASRKDNNNNNNKPSPAPTEIMIAALYIIIHISASLPKYRGIVASQTNLLKQVLALFSHASRVIRVNCCWIAINLTYGDDPSDRLGCRQRARELEKLGFFPKLMALQDDPDIDVRERMKTAINLLEQLLN